jgi:hypothetical protein
MEDREDDIELDLLATDPKDARRHRERNRSSLGSEGFVGRVCQEPITLPIDTNGYDSVS